MKVLDLFSGIGGFSLGLERAGMETVAFCEIEQFCQKVLKKHWPGVPIYEDVREVTAERLDSDGIRADIITAGYPCQPFSVAGKRGGEEDDRHLWPEVARLIRSLHPSWFIGENVPGHISMGLDEVLSDLESIGYAWEAFVIPACAIGADHRRDRVWIVANTSSERLQERQVNSRMERGKDEATWWKTSAIHSWRQPSPNMVRIADGIPGRVDRIRALGNAVVPQIPEVIGRAIMDCEKLRAAT